MLQLTRCCLLLPMIVLIESSLVAAQIYKSICIGDSVPLFTNIGWNDSRIVSLYTNSDKKQLIATWSRSNTSILPQYKERLFREEHGTIWIQNVEQSDQDTYELKYESGTQSKVKLQVLVAPSKHCKPTILKISDNLRASLDGQECGIPSAYVQWVDSPGISYIDRSIIKLPSGREPRTYYACTESPALHCVKDLTISAYCSSFAVEGDNCPPNNCPPSSDEASTVSNEMILISLIFVFVLIVLIILSVLLILLKKGTFANTAGARRNEENMQLFQSQRRTNGGHVDPHERD